MFLQGPAAPVATKAEHVFGGLPYSLYSSMCKVPCCGAAKTLALAILYHHIFKCKASQIPTHITSSEIRVGQVGFCHSRQTGTDTTLHQHCLLFFAYYYPPIPTTINRGLACLAVTPLLTPVSRWDNVSSPSPYTACLHRPWPGYPDSTLCFGHMDPLTAPWLLTLPSSLIR